MNIKETIKSFIDTSSPTRLKNWIEELLHINEQKEQENERLKAIIRELQGLPAKPVFNAKDKTSELDKDIEEDDDDNGNTPNQGGGKPRNGRKKAAGKKRRKKKDLEVDTIKKININPDDIDSTYQYKGRRKVIVQDIDFKRNNICFELEKYYSKEHKKTVEADLPQGFDGGYFGPNLIAFIKCLYYEGDATIKKIYRILQAIGTAISIRQINRIINDQPDELVEELEQARVAAIEKTGFQQIDDTGAKILGYNSAVTTVTCNPFFTCLYTSLSKNRRNAVMALSRAKEPLYKLNQQAIIVAFSSLKSLKIQYILEKYKSDEVYTDEEVDYLLEQEDFIKLKPKVLYDIKTAMLVGAFYDGELGIVGDALISDDAGQFNLLMDDHVLCWYHELRHYKELYPVTKEHKLALKLFFRDVKRGYNILKRWIDTREDKFRTYLLKWFTETFKAPTGYRLLDIRKAKTFEKMEKLLAPLWISIKVPLTNNESERDIRGKVIKRKISLFDRTWEGVRARDLYISLKQTCRKNGVSFYQFLLDRQQELNKIPQLANIITAS